MFDVKSAVSMTAASSLRRCRGLSGIGTGDILLNPSFLRDRKLRVKKEIFRADKGAAALRMIDSELRAVFLSGGYDGCAGMLRGSSRHVSFVLKHCPVKDGFPGKSQWNAVRTIAQKARTCRS